MHRIKWAALGAGATAAAAVGGYLFATHGLGRGDGLVGPVAEAARRALETGDLRWVLKWVSPAHETEVRALFAKVLETRKQGGQVRELADRAFREHLVRLHEIEKSVDVREPAPVEPAVALADEAVASGNLVPLQAALGASLERALRQRFARVAEAKPHADENVAKGRAYVAAYVDFVHLAEKIYAELESTETAAH
jgi:hypothetical protein